MNKIVSLSILFALVFIGCGDNSSKYESFNPEKVSFKDVGLKEDSAYKAKRDEFLKKLANRDFDTSTLSSADITKYRLDDALKKYIELVNEKSTQLNKEIKELAKNSVKEIVLNTITTGLEITDTKLITVSKDGVVTLFDKATLKKLSEFKTKARKVQKVKAFGKDKLVIATLTNKNYIYNYKTKKLLKTITVKGRETYDVFVDESRIYFAGEYAVTILSKKSFKTLKTFKHHNIWFMSVYADDKKIYVGNYRGRLEQYDKKTYKYISHRPHYQHIYAIAADKKYIYTASGDKSVKSQFKGLSGDSFEIKYDRKKTVGRLVINDNILYGTGDTSLHLWDLNHANWKLITEIKNEKGFNRVCVDEKAIYTATYDGFIQVWDKKKHFEITKLNKKIEDNKYYIANLKRKMAKKDLSVTIANAKELIKQSKLEFQQTLKHGKIGQRYVPYTTTSYSTPKTDTTYINGKSYMTTRYTDSSYSSGGYNTDVYGYKAIYKVTNNSDNYYQISMRFDWKGKYSHYKKQSYGAWSSKSGSYSKLVENEKNSYKIEKFFVAPRESFKFQFEVGEDKANTSLTDLNIKVVPQEYYDVFTYALEPKNKDIELLNKFKKDSKVSDWKVKIDSVSKEAKNIIKEAFQKKNKKDVSIDVVFDEKKFDKDFYSDVTLKVGASVPLCAKVSTHFGTEQIDVNQEGGFLIFKSYTAKNTYQVKDVSKERLKKIKEFEIAPSCEYFN